MYLLDSPRVLSTTDCSLSMASSKRPHPEGSSLSQAALYLQQQRTPNVRALTNQFSRIASFARDENETILERMHVLQEAFPRVHQSDFGHRERQTRLAQQILERLAVEGEIHEDHERVCDCLERIVDPAAACTQPTLHSRFTTLDQVHSMIRFLSIEDSVVTLDRMFHTWWWYPRFMLVLLFQAFHQMRYPATCTPHVQWLIRHQHRLDATSKLTLPALAYFYQLPQHAHFRFRDARKPDLQEPANPRAAAPERILDPPIEALIARGDLLTYFRVRQPGRYNRIEVPASWAVKDSILYQKLGLRQLFITNHNIANAPVYWFYPNQQLTMAVWPYRNLPDPVVPNWTSFVHQIMDLSTGEVSDPILPQQQQQQQPVPDPHHE